MIGTDVIQKIATSQPTTMPVVDPNAMPTWDAFVNFNAPSQFYILAGLVSAVIICCMYAIISDRLWFKKNKAKIAKAISPDYLRIEK
jgi:hypothetical protein